MSSVRGLVLHELGQSGTRGGAGELDRARDSCGIGVRVGGDLRVHHGHPTKHLGGRRHCSAVESGHRDVGVVRDEVARKRACGIVEQAPAGESVERGALVDGDVGHDLDCAVERRADVTIRGGDGQMTTRGVEWH